MICSTHVGFGVSSEKVLQNNKNYAYNDYIIVRFHGERVGKMILTAHRSSGSDSEALKIEDRIQGFIKMKDADLAGKGVIIALPTLAGGALEHEVMDKVQKTNAEALAAHIMDNMGADLVSIVTSPAKVSHVAQRVSPPYECVIFLHQFREDEKNLILDILKEQDPNVVHFELY